VQAGCRIPDPPSFPHEEKYPDDRLYANALAAKCAMCLALLAGIAVIGAKVDTAATARLRAQ